VFSTGSSNLKFPRMHNEPDVHGHNSHQMSFTQSSLLFHSKHMPQQRQQKIARWPTKNT